MNGPTFNIGYDPILSNPFPQMVDYSKEIDERVQYLQAMKERMSNTVQPTNNPNNSLWSAIDSEIGSLNDEQRNILFSDAKYIQIDNQLKQLIQEVLINSVKNVIEQSPKGSIKVTIPFMNKTVIFDKDDFNELKTNIEKYGKSE